MTYNPRYFGSGQVTTPQITEGAVTSDKIADETIESRDIKNQQVKTEDIADKAVTLAKLGDDVPSVGIPDNSISAAKLADNCVERRHLATGAVDTDELANQAVTAEKIRDATITNSKIATNTITQGKIANNAIGTGEIQNGAVTAEKLAPGAGGGSQITFLPTRLQLTSLIVSGNQDWMPSAPNPGIPAEATALLLQVELVQQSIAPPPQGFINCRLRRDATQQECYAIGVEARNVGQVYGGQVIVPITAGSFQYSFTDASGNVSVTFNPYVIGYIV
ncbi:MAG: hypothetical protein AAB038_00645 [Planctomycetota bacterium]